jgi:hypothetical protein
MRKTPAPTATSRMKIRCKFNNDIDVPILGDLIRLKRGEATRHAVALEAGVPTNVVMDVENYFSAKQWELDALLKWVGYAENTCQTPPPIIHRAFGRPRRDGTNEQPILEDILDWLAEGKPLSKYESVKFQVDNRRAQKMVTRYLRTSAEFKAAYQAARAVGSHHLADEIIEIADNPNINPAAASNMIKARQWLASHHNPSTFGNNTESNVNVNIGFGDALEQLEKRRKNALPAPERLNVIDVEPIELQRADLPQNASPERMGD